MTHQPSADMDSGCIMKDTFIDGECNADATEFIGFDFNLCLSCMVHKSYSDTIGTVASEE